MSRLISQAKSDISYLLFAEIYDRYENPKAKQKAFAIVEAAITCLSRKGFSQVSMEMIAREAGVSRALLSHYFDGMDHIRDTAFKYIRFLFQRLCVEEVKKATTPSEALKLYVNSCFMWSDNFRRHYVVWWIYLLRCTADTKLRALHTRATQVGADRIAQMLERGKVSGEFSFRDNSEAVAKNIQIVINGAIAVYSSENHMDKKYFRDRVVRLCLNLAEARM